MNKKDKIADFLNIYILGGVVKGGGRHKKNHPSNKNVGNISRNKSIQLNTINSQNNTQTSVKTIF